MNAYKRLYGHIFFLAFLKSETGGAAQAFQSFVINRFFSSLSQLTGVALHSSIAAMRIEVLEGLGTGI